MRTSFRFLLGLLFAAGLLAPAPVSAIVPVAPLQYSIPGLSSGGKIAAPPVPCLWAGLPALYVSLTSARATDPWAPEFYVWVVPPVPRAPVITRTDGFGPPARPRQQFLGITGLPTVCFTPTIPPVPLFGLLMHAIGTGNPVSTSFF